MHDGITLPRAISPDLAHPSAAAILTAMANPIHGCCDGIFGETLCGWIANTAQPRALEQILCWGDGVTPLRFSACFGRADVCRGLAQQGRFGFAIPLAALRPLGPVIRITTVEGRDLPGGSAVALPPAASPPPTDPPWVMLHIPKTAGTSLRQALITKFQPGDSLHIYDDGFTGISHREFAALPPQQREAARLVIGHMQFGIDRYLPRRAHYVTVLRAPLARLRSNYHHHVAQGTVFRRDGQTLPTVIAVQQAATEEFDNLMTRLLSGVTMAQVPIGALHAEHVDQALENMRTRFRFVGLLEKLEAHYTVLRAIMDLPLHALAHSNPDQAGDPAGLDGQVDWDLAMAKNRFDTALYDRAQAEGLCGIDLAR